MSTTHTSCFRQILTPLFDLCNVLEIITFGNHNGPVVDRKRYWAHIFYRWLTLTIQQTSLSVADSFRKHVFFWMKRHHDMALWRLDGGAWLLFFLMTATSTAELTLLTKRLVEASGKYDKNWNWGSRANYGPYRWLELPNHRINGNVLYKLLYIYILWKFTEPTVCWFAL